MAAIHSFAMSVRMRMLSNRSRYRGGRLAGGDPAVTSSSQELALLTITVATAASRTVALRWADDEWPVPAPAVVQPPKLGDGTQSDPDVGAGAIKHVPPCDAMRSNWRGLGAQR